MSEAQEFDINARTEAPLHGSEVAILRASLAYQRDTLRWKCSGLTQEQLAQQCPPTEMTLGGLMKHLALVESQWFDHWFRDAGFAPPFDTVDWALIENDWEFESARDDTPEQLRALFDEAVSRRTRSSTKRSLAADSTRNRCSPTRKPARPSPCGGSWST